MMRFVNVSRKKDALIIIGSLVLMAAALSLQFWLSENARRRPRATSPDPILQRRRPRPENRGDVPAEHLGDQGPSPSAPGASGLGSFLLYAGVSLALFAALFFAARAFFYRGLLGLGEVSARRQRLSRRRPFGADLLRPKAGPGRSSSGSCRIMNRTPIFLLNGVLSVVLIPVIFILFAKAGSGGGKRHDPDHPPSGFGESGSHDSRFGPFHDDLRLPERNGGFGLFPGGVPLLDVPDHPHAAGRSRPRRNSSTPMPWPAWGS